MRDLLRMLVDAAQSILLFAQNVRRIGVYHLPKRGGAPRDPALVCCSLLTWRRGVVVSGSDAARIL